QIVAAMIHALTRAAIECRSFVPKKFVMADGVRDYYWGRYFFPATRREHSQIAPSSRRDVMFIEHASSKASSSLQRSGTKPDCVSFQKTLRSAGAQVVFARVL